VHLGTAADEQAWNAERLASPIREPQFRVWIYERSELVLGHAQAVARARTRVAAGPAVTRESGGGAVLVGPWLVGLSIALPPHHPLVAPSIVDSYRWLGEVHVDALRRLGVDAVALSPSDFRTRSADGPVDLRWACFGSLSPWEVVGRGGRKLVGLAQARRRTGVLLVAGTLTSTPDWTTLAELMGQPPLVVNRLAAVTTSCESELGRRVSPAAFAAALNQELGRRL
jgi:lipoate---protein ligase